MSDYDERFFDTEAALPAGARSYIRRAVDDTLPEVLGRGELCYIVTARQTGKTSLIVRTTPLLARVGTSVAMVDLSRLGTQMTIEQWYFGMLEQIGEDLGLSEELDAFWEGHTAYGPLDRWARALKDVVLPARTGRVVIFIDEIGVVSRIHNFSPDEFFAALRSWSQRGDDPEFSRLTFCLVGSVPPLSLYSGFGLPVFNVGRRIDLDDFTRKEVDGLSEGLVESGRDEETAGHLLDRIHLWTHGHPYLTQKFCREIAARPEIQSDEDVDRLCADLFFKNPRMNDEHNLTPIADQLSELAQVDGPGGIKALELYRKIYSKSAGVRDEERDPNVDTLRTLGVVRRDGERLVVRNRIYEEVFDLGFIDKVMQTSESRREVAALRKKVGRIVAGALVVCFIFLSLVVWTLGQKDKAEKSRANSEIALNCVRVEIFKLIKIDNDNTNSFLDDLLRYTTVRKPLEDRLRGIIQRFEQRANSKAHDGEDPLFLILAAATKNLYGHFLNNVHEYADALNQCHDAVVFQRRALDLELPPRLEHLADLSLYYGELAEAQREIGQPGAGKETESVRAALWKDNPEELYKGAMRLNYNYPYQAKEVMTWAFKRGFRNVVRLKEDRDRLTKEDRERLETLLNAFRANSEYRPFFDILDRPERHTK